MKVLLVGAPESKGFFGGGGREAALAWLLDRSESVTDLYWPTANGFRSQLKKWRGPSAPFANFKELVGFCWGQQIDLVVIGPEQPLADGLADALRKADIAVFGPGQAAAQIEASKLFAKWIMANASVASAPYVSFNNYAAAVAYVHSEHFMLPAVVKADGLAEGKGVIVCKTIEEVLLALDRCLVKHEFGQSGDTVLIEQFLKPYQSGLHCEASVIVFVDKYGNYVMAPLTQDNKAVFDGGHGPNTGGTAATTMSWPTSDDYGVIERTIVRPTIRTMKGRGMPFTGVLYFGLMRTPDGWYVVEINCRPGDPEWPVLAMLWPDDEDFGEFLRTIATGRSLAGREIKWKSGHAACIVMMSGGYPGSYEKGFSITGPLKPWSFDSGQGVVFHAGTLVGDPPTTNGGRVLEVCAGPCQTVAEACEEAYKRVRQILWQNVHYRKDIGQNMPNELP